MAKGQTLADLVVRLKAEGLEDVEFLRKELKAVSSQTKISETSFKGLISEIKNFSKATEKTTTGLKGQIAAFEKLRDRAAFQGKAYRQLTREIVGMNKALAQRLGIEKDLGSSGGRYRVSQPGADITSGLLASSFFAGQGTSRQSGTQAEFDKRISSLQLLMYNRTWESLNERQQNFLNDIKRKGKLEDGDYSLQGRQPASAIAGVIRDANAQKVNLQQRGQLNDLQLQALGITKALDIKSDDYLEVLTKINAEEGHQNKILSQQELRARADIANKKARTIATNRLADAQQRAAEVDAYGLYKGAMRGGTQVPLMSKDFAKAPEQFTRRLSATRRFLGQNMLQRQIQQVLSVLNLRSPLYKEVEAEAAYNDPTYFAKYINAKGGSADIYRPESLASFLRPKTGRSSTVKAAGQYGRITTGRVGEQINAMIDRQGRVEREDFFGLGADLGYPMTPRGQQSLIGDLQNTLQDLTPGTENYKTVKEELTRVTERWLKVNEKANKSLKDAQKEYAGLSKKALPAAGQTGKKGGALAIYDPSFAMKQAGAGPNAIEQTVESLDQYLLRVRKSTKAQNLNINSLTKQRAKLDEIRNGLDPTSVAFRNATKAINSTDKALSKLNSNRFSGKNLMRTGQSILGAAYFGGFGGGLGAGIGGLLGGPGGAVTGGLVGSQIAQPITQFIGGSATYASDIAKLHIALETAAGSAENYKKALATAELVTQRFNVPQEIAARGMTRLTAAVVGAGGTVEHAAIAFHNITAAIKGTAGTAEDVKSAVTAMVQIFSKGRVSAEELSGQLGERFPGAVTKFQEANKEIYKSTADLQDALKKGEVGLNELWEFVMLLGVDFTKVAADIAASPEEAGMRAIIKMNALRVELGKKLKPLGAEFQVIQADLLEELIPVIENLADVGVKAGEAILEIIKFIKRDLLDLLGALAVVAGTTGIGLLIAQIVKLNASWFAMGKAIIGVKKAMAALNVVSMVNPWIALASGIATAIYWYNRWEARQKGLAAKAAAGDEDAIKELRERLNEDIKAWKEHQNDYMKTIQNPLFDPDNKDGSKGGGWRFKVFGNMFDQFKETHDARNKVLEDRIKEATKAIAEGNEALSNKLIEQFKVGIKEFKFPDMKKALKGEGETDLGKYIDSLGNKGEHLQNVFINAFKNMEDALVNFVMTGKLNFKEFARSVIADISRMIIKMMMFNAIKGFGGWLGGGDKKAATNPVTATVADGGVFAKNGIVPYAKGGIVDKPTYFPFAKGVGLMGEAGPEAIIPLQRGKNGKLGIAGGGGTTTVNVSVDAKGTKVEGDGKQMAQLGRMLGSAIEAELVKQKRPGGLLA